MTRFRAIGLDVATTHRLRSAMQDDAGNVVMLMASTGTAPCRFTLTDHPEGAAMLLLGLKVPRPAGVNAQVSPILMSSAGGLSWDAVDVIPPVVAARQVALRAYDANGMMVYPANRLICDGGHEAVVRRMLEWPDVAFANCHTALAGCYLCRFERA